MKTLLLIALACPALAAAQSELLMLNAVFGACATEAMAKEIAAAYAEKGAKEANRVYKHYARLRVDGCFDFSTAGIVVANRVHSIDGTCGTISVYSVRIPTEPLPVWAPIVTEKSYFKCNPQRKKK